MGYEDYIEPMYKGCKHHKVKMCDADTVASYCEHRKCWCSLISHCEI